ncbi:MAG: 50S ribosomal protein L30 [Candidatus Heimdallarchaeota archaeon]|nr:MAG: 50S ribosomal protein L30 [Candidatus Gerdarchaeota archaeon]RLI73181.1 MAG: 50S ribosomal protein L30 [Candidatus Heimdallarchaeota archaeon]
MSTKKDAAGLLAIVRIRGNVDQPKDVKHALKLLNLTRPNHAVVVPNDATHRGMLQKVKDAVTWGEIDKRTLTALLKKRGKISGNKKLTTTFLKQHKFESLSAFVTALLAGKADMRRIEGLKPLFRLHPPRKGFKSVKNPVQRHGDLGYRGAAINELLERMM